jgi:L-amino acid N-acyltransferase YncA
MDEARVEPAGVKLRVATESDLTAIVDLYAGLSEASFATRFMQARVDRALLARCAAFDTSHGAVVVLAEFEDEPGTPVGEGRYIPTGDGAAEFAVVVDDHAQGRGIGGALLAELRRIAALRGVDRLWASIQAENTAMLRVIELLDFALTEGVESGTVFLELSTGEGMPGWPADGQRHVLVESRSWHDSPDVQRLRAAGATVRHCLGPRQTCAAGMVSQQHACPLVLYGRCPLAEGADEILDLLPDGVPAYDAILAEHHKRWPARVRT